MANYVKILQILVNTILFRNDHALSLHKGSFMVVCNGTASWHIQNTKLIHQKIKIKPYY